MGESRWRKRGRDRGSVFVSIMRSRETAIMLMKLPPGTDHLPH